LSVFFWLCFVGLTGLALSPAPYLPPQEIFNWWDKAQHAIDYGSLTMSALLAYPNKSKWKLAALLCFHGCLVEVLQYFSGYRYGDWQDALADGLGVALFVILTRFKFMEELICRSVHEAKGEISVAGQDDANAANSI
jgi:VanZ family protein